MKLLLLTLAMVHGIVAYTDQQVIDIFDDLLDEEGIEFDEGTYVTRLATFFLNTLDMDENDEESSPNLNDMYDEDETRDRDGAKLDESIDNESGVAANLELQKREDDLVLNKRAVPSSYDSRQSVGLNEAVNQGKCGNCYLHTFIAALEIAYTKTTGKLRKFSEQEMTDCYYKGCHGGDYRQVANSLAYTDHLSSRDDYGDYLSFDVKDHFVCRADSTPDALTGIRVVGYVDVTPATVDRAVSGYGSVMTCMDWTGLCKAIKDYNGRSVFDGPTVENGCQHAVLIVGYTPDYYIVRNSHGKTWGDKGYFKIKRGTNACGIEQSMAAVIVEKRASKPGLASNGCRNETPKVCSASNACVKSSEICLPLSTEEEMEKRSAAVRIPGRAKRGSRKRLKKFNKGHFPIPGLEKRDENDEVALVKRCADRSSSCPMKAMLCSRSSVIKSICPATCNSCSNAIVVPEPVLPTDKKGKCYKPSIANGYVYNSNTYLSADEAVRVGCRSGYSKTGEDVKCLRQDEFYGNLKDGRLLPECVWVGGETYTGNGADYQGSKSQTISGQECLSWNQEILRGDVALMIKTNEIGNYRLGNHNFCRNPGGAQPVPVCIADASGGFGFCFSYPGCDKCSGASNEGDDEECDSVANAGKCKYTTSLRVRGPDYYWDYCQKSCCKVARC